MTGKLRLLLGCLSLFALHAADRSDATGSMSPVPCSLFYAYRLVLVRFQERILDRSIEFDLPSDWRQKVRAKQWTEVGGRECSDQRQCEPAAEAKVQITRFPRRGTKTVSGQFVVLFRDGRKFEGSFQARYLWRPLPRNCEELSIK
jgi:hypothetical protein